MLSDLFIFSIFLALGLLLYLLPAVVAARRNHPQRFPILILTICFAWTGIGWVVLLAWSFNSMPVNKLDNILK